MRARETQKWLLYALLGPLALAAFGWGILLQIVLCECHWQARHARHARHASSAAR